MSLPRFIHISSRRSLCLHYSCWGSQTSCVDSPLLAQPTPFSFDFDQLDNPIFQVLRAGLEYDFSVRSCKLDAGLGVYFPVVPLSRRLH